MWLGTTNARGLYNLFAMCLWSRYIVNVAVHCNARAILLVGVGLTPLGEMERLGQPISFSLIFFGFTLEITIARIQR